VAVTGVAVGNLRAARPEVLSATARRIEDHRLAVVRIVETVLRGRSVALSGAGSRPSSRWSGPAASAAASRFSALAGELAQVARDLAVCSQALSHAGLRLRAALTLLSRAEARAGERGARVTEAGDLVVPVRAPRGDPVLDAHEAREDTLMRAEVTAYLRQAERVATETDVELARHLRITASGCVAAGERGVLTSLAPPPVSRPGDASGDVFANAAWWHSVTSEERGRIIRDHPEWVGPRDGLPAADRDLANRTLLDRAERAARGRIAALEAGAAARPDELGAGGAAVLGLGLSERATALELVRRRLDALRAVRGVLARRDGTRRRLLLVDVSGRHPRAAVAIGEVDTAEHVATFVGGFTTTVSGDLDRYDRDLAQLRSSSLGMARGDVAIVTWLGYPAPQVDEVLSPSRTVISPAAAARGGDDLAAFVTGLDASRAVPADQSVLAHSYGSVVLSFALRRPTGIDRVALFGSPGTGGAVRSVVDTGLKPGAFSVLGSIDDPVVASGRLVLGPPAASVVGARALSTYAPGGAGSEGGRRTSRGHSSYLKTGSDSAFNLATVVADRRDASVPESSEEKARKAVP
jgi:hypothetical protein